MKDDRVKLHDLEFERFIPNMSIRNAITRITNEIRQEYYDKQPIFIGVLNGSFMFFADLMKGIDFNCEVSFIKVSSYEGTASTGKINRIIGANPSIKDRHIIIVEDIVDTGTTIEYIIKEVEQYKPKDIKICSLLLKTEIYSKDIEINYVGFEIPNIFVVGYGLDYKELGRNMKNIYRKS